MDARKQKVLAAVIQDYILTGEPVGSRTIARRYNLGVSPATIRNEMADLEEMGLLEQPHTSAGRVPSDHGYRYYVDCLLPPAQLTPVEEEYVRQRYNQKMLEIEQVLAETTRLISDMTSYAAIALGPDQGRASLEQVQVLPIQAANKALLVAITSTGVVEHRAFTVPENVTLEDLNRISRVLNSRLQGRALDELRQMVLSDIFKELAHHRNLVNLVKELLQQVLFQEGGEKVYRDGTLNILNQPEFKDVDQVRGVLSFLDQDEALRRTFMAMPASGLTVRIGQENKAQGIDKCSVVTISYAVEGKIRGKVGLLGPTRMQYARAISVIRYVADALSQTLEQLYR